MKEEEIIWEGKTSLRFYIFDFLAWIIPGAIGAYFAPILAFIPVAGCIWEWRSAKLDRYYLTRKALVSISSADDGCKEEIPIGEVKFLVVRQPFIFRLLSCSTVIFVVDTSADTQPCVVCISNAKTLVEKLNQCAPTPLMVSYDR